jgi:hypothetical protein
VAQVCRRLWKRISGRPAVLRSGLKDPAVKLGDKLSYEEMEALIKEWLSSRYRPRILTVARSATASSTRT